MTPMGAFLRLNQQNAFLLESVIQGKNIGQYSLIGYDPLIEVQGYETYLVIMMDGQQVMMEGNPLDKLKEFYQSIQHHSSTVSPLTTGFFGYFTWEIISSIEPIELKGEKELLFEFQLPKKLLIFDHVKQLLFISNSSFSKMDGKPITDQVFNDIPIGFVSSNKEPVLRTVEGNKLIGPVPFAEQFDTNAGHNIGLRLSIPIFNGNVIQNSLQRSKVNLLRSQNQLEQEKLNLENTINQAYNNAEGAYKFYEAAQKTEFARKKAYLDAVNRYEAGVVNTFDFNQIKQRYEASGLYILAIESSCDDTR